MALTQSVWTPKTVNGYGVWQCTVIATAAENDAYTLKTPADSVDGRRPWIVLLQCTVNPDAGGAVTVEIATGHADNFAVTGDAATLGATNGAIFKQILDDCSTIIPPLEAAFLIHPDLPVADVVTIAAIAAGLKANVPPAPYYAFNLNAGTTMDAHTATWTIVQKL